MTYHLTDNDRHIIDCVYLSIVNDRKAYEFCLNELLTKPADYWDSWRIRSPFVFDARKLTEDRSNISGPCNRAVRDLIFLQVVDHLYDHIDNETYDAIHGYVLANNPEFNSETPTEDSVMESKNTTPFETRDYVFGKNTNDMTNDELLSAMRKVEGEISSLKSIETKSKYVDGKIKEGEEALKRIVEKLDERA